MPELLNQQELRRRLPCSLAGSRIPLWVVTIGMGVDLIFTMVSTTYKHTIAGM